MRFGWEERSAEEEDSGSGGGCRKRSRREIGRRGASIENKIRRKVVYLGGVSPVIMQSSSLYLHAVHHCTRATETARTTTMRRRCDSKRRGSERQHRGNFTACKLRRNDSYTAKHIATQKTRGRRNGFTARAIDHISSVCLDFR